MKHVARNLARHPNGNYYAVFDGVPESLRTKSRREAKRLLADKRRERASSATATRDQVSTAPGAPVISASSATPEMAALQAVIADLAAQVAAPLLN